MEYLFKHIMKLLFEEHNYLFIISPPSLVLVPIQVKFTSRRDLYYHKSTESCQLNKIANGIIL